MKKLFLVTVFYFLQFSAANCENFVVAKINNKAITNDEIDDRFRLVLSISGIRIKDNSDQKILRQQIIDKMIDEELIRQEAQSLKMEVGSEEVKDAIEVIALQRKQNPTQFKLFFANFTTSEPILTASDNSYSQDHIFIICSNNLSI